MDSRAVAVVGLRHQEHTRHDPGRGDPPDGVEVEEIGGEEPGCLRAEEAAPVVPKTLSAVAMSSASAEYYSPPGYAVSSLSYRALCRISAPTQLPETRSMQTTTDQKPIK